MNAIETHGLGKRYGRTWALRNITPTAFADHASEWVSRGATIVGGCCAIGPEHIAELAGVTRAFEDRS